MINRSTPLAILALCALATVAVAQGPSGPHKNTAFAPRASGFERGFERLGFLENRLDLTEEQETAIEAIRDQAREQAVELRKQQARLQNEIDGELLADAPSETKLVDLTEKLGAVRTDLQVIRLKTRLAVRAELTDEQRDQLVLMGDRRGPHGSHGLHRRHESGDHERMFRLHRHGLQADQDDDDEDEI